MSKSKRMMEHDPFRFIGKKKKSKDPEPPKEKEPLLKRATFILEPDMIDMVRAHAYWERMEISHVIRDAILLLFKNKKVKPIPNTSSGRAYLANRIEPSNDPTV